MPQRRKGTKAGVFVRIRPVVYDGSGHDQNGDAVAKSVEAWDDKSVTLGTAFMFSKGNKTYSFPRQVFGPEVKQEQVYETVVAPLTDAFTDMHNGKNIIFFAYGQTGTGKTHTMFGTDASLRQTELNDGWGCFPRMVHGVLNAMAGTSRRFSLKATAIEFYLYQVFDLLNGRAPLELDEDFHPINARHLVINDMADIESFLDNVQNNRVAAHTLMNQAAGDHGGSSRSHCALILTLQQLDTATNEFRETTFSLVDLAGAERPEKTGDKRYSSAELIEALYSGADLPIGAQGFMINFELSALSSQILAATDMFRRGKTYTPASTLVPPVVQFVCNQLNGSAIMRMMVCVSQAPQCGWETWFSMNYGTDMSKLESNIKSVKVVDIDKLRNKWDKRSRKLKDEVKVMKPKPGTRTEVFYHRKKNTISQLLRKIQDIDCLVEGTGPKHK